MSGVGGKHPFSKCGACRRRWATWQEFLDDSEVSLVGLQMAEHMPEANLLVFEHACGSSISVRTARLRFLAAEDDRGPEPPARLGTEECQEVCKRLAEWKACDRPCVNARARRVLQRILQIKEGQARQRRVL